MDIKNYKNIIKHNKYMSKIVVIKYINVINNIDFPIYISIDTSKSSKMYTSLCTIRNNLIENGIVDRELRYKMHFYKDLSIQIKVKEGDILDGIIYLKIENEVDYSEPVNILYHLEKRITDFERKFKYTKERKGFLELKNLWINFREENSDCFDYSEWFFVMKPIKDEIQLLNKIALDIRKWLIQKDKIISELNLVYLSTIICEEQEQDYELFSKFLYDI